MKPLALTEALFQDYVLAGNCAIADEIDGASQALRDARLSIYRDAYRLRLVEVLASDYAVLHAYLGDERFNELAANYVAAHPSTFRNVRWFGGGMAHFLEGALRYAEHRELAELARFEWALGQAFDAPDEAVAHIEDATAVAPEAWTDLRFRAHPSLRTMESHTNAVAIWKDIGIEAVPCAAENLAEPIVWAIWRKQHSPFFRSLEKDEAKALDAMLAGASFGEICTGLCEGMAEEAAAPRAAGLLHGWLEQGLIAELMSRPGYASDQ